MNITFDDFSVCHLIIFRSVTEARFDRFEEYFSRKKNRKNYIKNGSLNGRNDGNVETEFINPLP